MKIGDKATLKRTFTQDEFNIFAKLSGDDNPIHVDPEFSARTKFGKTVAHGMLLYSTIGRCLGTLLPGSGTIQAAQELMFPNPTFVGQEITVELEIKSFPSPGIAEIITNIAHTDRKMGCVGKCLVWIPGSGGHYEAVEFETPRYESAKREHRGLHIGQSADIQRHFTHDDLREYISLVGEANLVYTDSEFARSLGFRDVLVPGGLLGGMVSDLLGTQLPGRGTNWLKQRYHFLKPVYPEEEITTRVEILRLRPIKDLVNLRTTLRNQDEEIVIDGEALVLVSDLEM